MGAAARRGHVVVCGWSTTARDLVAELTNDDQRREVVVLHDGASADGPDASGVESVRGDAADVVDLARADVGHAQAVVICPPETTDRADMRSILAVMAIRSVAPQARVSVVVNDPARVDHFRREGADEVIVTSQVVASLLARSSLYPGLGETAVQLLTGRDGAELHRAALPEDYARLSVDELSAHLRRQHRATLVAISREGRAHVNPAADFALQPGDEAVVVAESLRSLGTLRPLGAGEASAALPTQARPRAAKSPGAVAAHRER